MARRKNTNVPLFVAISGTGLENGEVAVGQTPEEAYKNLEEIDNDYGYGELDISAVTVLKVQAYGKPEIKLDINWLTPESM